MVGCAGCMLAYYAELDEIADSHEEPNDEYAPYYTDHATMTGMYDRW